MARWRDIKQGKIVEQKKKKKKKFSPELTISPISKRLKAFAIDTFMILMPILYFVMYVVMGSREEFAQNMGMGWLYIILPHFAIFMGFWLLKGQTPGHKVEGILILNRKLEKPKPFQFVIRYFVAVISFIFPVGLLASLFRKDKLNLHDLLSGTMPVIKNK